MNTNDRRDAFVSEYMVDFNATQAAIRAGYAENGANRAGSRLLKDPAVAAVVADAMADRRARMRATADAAVADLWRRARFDIAAYSNIRSPEDLDGLSEEQRIPIEGWTWTKEGRFVLTFASKTANGATLLRHLGLLKDKVDVEHSGGVTVVLNGDEALL